MSKKTPKPRLKAAKAAADREKAFGELAQLAGFSVGACVDGAGAVLAAMQRMNPEAFAFALPRLFSEFIAEAVEKLLGHLVAGELDPAEEVGTAARTNLSGLFSLARSPVAAQRAGAARALLKCAPDALLILSCVAGLARDPDPQVSGEVAMDEGAAVVFSFLATLASDPMARSLIEYEAQRAGCEDLVSAGLELEAAKGGAA